MNMNRYTVTNLKTGEKKSFTGGPEAKAKALTLDDKWSTVDYESEPIEEGIEEGEIKNES